MATFEKLQKFAMLEDAENIFKKPASQKTPAHAHAHVLKRKASKATLKLRTEELPLEKVATIKPIKVDKTPKVVKFIPKQHQAVRSFMKQRQTPPWFRGTSMFQSLAYNRLWGSLRDDMEQETTYRTQLVLKEIGLAPMITSKQTRYLMALSRGNDLAFLWFLMEMYYKTDKSQGTYDINEQLIMSGIAHLDMITTLRGLNRILPPSQLSKFEVKCQKREKLKKKREAEKERRKLAALEKQPTNVNAERKNPYLQRLILPRERKSNLTSAPPPFQVKIGPYEKYKSSAYMVQNERNRWFAQYKLRPSERIATRILKNELKSLALPDLNELFKEEFIDCHVDGIVQDLQLSTLKKETVQTLCENHRYLKEMEERLKMQLQLIAKEKCRKYFDVTTHMETVLQKRIGKQLEEDVEATMNAFRKMTDTVRKKLAIIMLTKVADFETRIIDTENDEEWKEECINPCAEIEKKARQAKKLKKISINFRKSDPNWCELNECMADTDDCTSEKELQFFGIPVMKNARKALNAEKAAKAEMDEDEYADETPEAEEVGDQAKIAKNLILQNKDGTMDLKQWISLPHIPCKTGKKRRCSLSNYLQSKYVAAYDYSRSRAPLTPTPSQIFFKIPKDNLPFNFDYHKVFYRNGNNAGNHLKLKKTVVEALINDVDLLNRLENEKLKDIRARDPQLMKLETELVQRLHDVDIPDTNAAVKDCALNIWRKAVKQKTAEMVAEEERARKLKPELRESELIFEKYKRSYYDPDDMVLMRSMLKDGLAYLARDPKYVLASFPFAENLTVLIEWTRLRFGKTYSAKQREKDYYQSLKVFKVLNRASLLSKMPTTKAMGRKLFISYHCRPFVERKARFVRKQFYQDVDATILEQSRVFWLSMRPYLCSGGPPRNTFFAYMPSRIQDITHFHIWNPYDFRNHKTLRESIRDRNNPTKEEL